MRFWLSFADDDGCRGVCVVETQTDDLLEAVSQANALGINPGGQVLGFLLRDGAEPEIETGRLYSKAELTELGYLSIAGEGGEPS